MPQHDEGDDPRLEALVAMARESAARTSPPIDIDRAVAVAAAVVERRRVRRLAAMRVGGIGLVLALLAVWTIGFADGGLDVLYSLVMFVMPALAVLRWHLKALDGGGLRPWRVPRTVPAWSREARRRGDVLAVMVDDLDALLARLTAPADAGGPGAGSGPLPGGLEDRLRDVRRHVSEVVLRVERCQAGADEFIEGCRTSPGEVNWRLLRDIEPAGLHELLRQGLIELDEVVRYSSDLSGRAAPLTLELCEARREIELLLRNVPRRCGRLVDAFDALHGLAVQGTLAGEAEIDVVRRATSRMAVTVSGWGRPAAQRSVIRNVLVAEARGGRSWLPTIRRARDRGRQEVLAYAGGVS